MKKRYLNASIFIIVIIAVAFTGLFVGQKFMHLKMQKDWHIILHNKLELTNQQNIEITKLENIYLAKKDVLKSKLHMANIKLADALKQDKSYSNKVENAVDEIHIIMGEMQKLTIQHLLNIRPILTKEQNNNLEKIVTNALYSQQGKQHKKH